MDQPGEATAEPLSSSPSSLSSSLTSSSEHHGHHQHQHTHGKKKKSKKRKKVKKEHSRKRVTSSADDADVVHVHREATEEGGGSDVDQTQAEEQNNDQHQNQQEQQEQQEYQQQQQHQLPHHKSHVTDTNNSSDGANEGVAATSPRHENHALMRRISSVSRLKHSLSGSMELLDEDDEEIDLDTLSFAELKAAYHEAVRQAQFAAEIGQTLLSKNAELEGRVSLVEDELVEKTHAADQALSELDTLQRTTRTQADHLDQAKAAIAHLEQELGVMEKKNEERSYSDNRLFMLKASLDQAIEEVGDAQRELEEEKAERACEAKASAQLRAKEDQRKVKKTKLQAQVQHEREQNDILKLAKRRSDNECAEMKDMLERSHIKQESLRDAKLRLEELLAGMGRRESMALSRRPSFLVTSPPSSLMVPHTGAGMRRSTLVPEIAVTAVSHESNLNGASTVSSSSAADTTDTTLDTGTNASPSQAQAQAHDSVGNLMDELNSAVLREDRSRSDSGSEHVINIVVEKGLMNRENCEEYFFLALTAVKIGAVMRDPKLVDVVAEIDSQSLFEKAQQNEVPFHEWHNWIVEQLYVTSREVSRESSPAGALSGKKEGELGDTMFAGTDPDELDISTLHLCFDKLSIDQRQVYLVMSAEIQKKETIVDQKIKEANLYRRDVAALKGKIETLTHNNAKQTNLDYVKNVVLDYIERPNKVLIPVLAELLAFTPEELDRAENPQPAGGFFSKFRRRRTTSTNPVAGTRDK